MSRAPLARPDPWVALRRFTPARLALGRAGAALPTAELLALELCQARARDAVHAPLDAAALEVALGAEGHPTTRVASAAPDRAAYLARPDLGRRLAAGSGDALEALAARAPAPEVVLVAGDGLSALAAARHLPPLLAELRALGRPWAGAPVVVATQARVALGDEVGERLSAALAVVALGERPGLSAHDSLGLYLTWAPRRGRSDAERACISNVRPEGLGYAEAARQLDRAAREAARLRRTGVAR